VSGESGKRTTKHQDKLASFEQQRTRANANAPSSILSTRHPDPLRHLLTLLKFTVAVEMAAALNVAGRHRFGAGAYAMTRRTMNLASFQQTRSYVYIPLSWQDFRERFQRWMESAEHRVVNVQVLSRRKLKDERIKQQKLWVGMVRKDKAQWNSWFKRRRQNMSAYSLSLPLPNVRRSMTVEKLNRRYQGWKSRRKDEYKGWRARRKEEYQDWKSSRKESFDNWKTRAFLKNKEILVKEYSQPHWFDDMGRPLTSRDSTGRFVNPWKSQSTNGIHAIDTILNWQYLRMKRHINYFGFWNSLAPSATLSAGMPPLPNPSPLLPRLVRDDTSKLQLTWIGHATCYVQFHGTTILLDPMFSLRSGPAQWAPIGPRRELAPSHTIDELLQHTGDNTIDICCITHDHYDHLDHDSVQQLRGLVQLWVVPLGMKDWLMTEVDVASESIVELQWWEQTHIFRKDGQVRLVDEPKESDFSSRAPLTITCCPASHWGSRKMSDRNTRLWCSFAVSSNDQRLFLSGDTGYPDFPLFRQIGDALGPFDLAAIPIGAYEPAELNKDSHANPYEAVQIHKDLRSLKSVAIHWGSFPLGEEDMKDPPKQLKMALEKENIEETEFFALEHGATIEANEIEADEIPVASRG
jgi:N-acyl-phosphatidylethanolamine-hydrolysing phospholipase D